MSPTRAVASSRIVLVACMALALGGCGGEDEPDAYGNFEATETVVSAETGGSLLWFTPVDGQQVAYIYGDVWTQYSAAISPGIREIQWRFERDTYSGQPTDAAYIDDVVFAP